jgi:hypothetical protein
MHSLTHTQTNLSNELLSKWIQTLIMYLAGRRGCQISITYCTELPLVLQQHWLFNRCIKIVQITNNYGLHYFKKDTLWNRSNPLSNNYNNKTNNTIPIDPNQSLNNIYFPCAQHSEFLLFIEIQILLNYF